MKAAIYARVSTERQLADGKSSMDDQLGRCVAMCEARGWEIVETYDEGDASAGTAHRVEFQRLLADAKAGRFDDDRDGTHGVIVVREVSRLSRVAQARRAIEELMVEYDVAVLNARSGMLYSEREGLGAGLLWTIEAKLAEAEWAERSYRTNLGMFGKAKQGLVPGSKAPFGYWWTGGEGNSLAIEPREADVVRLIFKRIGGGQTCATVARELNESGEPTPGADPSGEKLLKYRAGHGGKDPKRIPSGRWLASTVYDIATRKAYIGRFEYGREKWVRLNSERDRQAWAREYTVRHGMPPKVVPAKIRVKGEHVYECASPVIVPDALWRSVVRRLTKSRKGARVARRPAMLLGILRCEECGREMRATWAKGRAGESYNFYRCGQSVKDPDRFPCRVRDRAKGLTAYVSAKSIEGLVWELVDRMLRDRDTLERAIGLRLAEHEAMEPAADSSLARAEGRKANTESAWALARRVYFAGELDEAHFAADKVHYERELAMLTSEIERMRDAAEQRAKQRDRVEIVRLMAANWPAFSASLSELDKGRIVLDLVRDVTVSKDDQVTVSGTLGKIVSDSVSTVVGTGGPYPLSVERLAVAFELVGRLAA